MARQFVFFGRSSSLLLLIFYKLLLAAIEAMAGVLCLIGAFFIKHVALTTTISEIANKDRLDEFVNWLVHYLNNLALDYQLVLHIGLVLVALGIFNVFVAIGVWFKSHKMRTIALLVFSVLSVYSAYELFIDFSTFSLIALLLDLIILYYFWRILPRHMEN